jgi:L-aspartate oxidase
LKRRLSTIATDFLVLGSGVAGLQAALDLAQGGQVLILNKGKGPQGSSPYAQGGIAVAMGGPKDREAHYQDTLKAGAGMCREEAVRILVMEGPRRIKELIAWGARFDRKGGQFLFAKEAAHSQARVLRAKGDTTGEEIVRTLLRQLKQRPNIKVLNHHFILDLVIRDGICLGALALNERTRQSICVLAKATILATGGAGQIYLRTTNPQVATGDGIAMAYRAGAILEDMEFVQFHPTALCIANAPAFLLTEALRGEGAILKNKRGDAFMKCYHPAKDLAPRDVVSRAIWAEMQADHLPHAYLDMTHLDKTYIKKRFPMIYKTCLSFGLDFTREPIPVSPAAHFMIGGVKTDLEGAATLHGLFAVGEVACTQVHGANRLGSNSLLEGLVFGARAGKAARRFAARYYKNTGIPVQSLTLDLTDLPDLSDDQTLEIQREVKQTMWEKVGVVRSEKSLQVALRVLTSHHHRLKGCYPSRQIMETLNMATVAMLICTAAINRSSSAGVHFRSDHPKIRERNWWEHKTLSQRTMAAFGLKERVP